MKVSKVLWLFIFIVLSAAAQGQLAGTNLINAIQYHNSSGKVSILQDPDIVKLVDKHLYEEGRDKVMIGYRIRIFSNSGAQAREQGQRAMANFVTYFGDKHQTYFVWDSPFYLLYVGDFRTQSEAAKFLKKLEIHFPEAFVVRSKIDYPKIK
ncbi:MAG: SPOR domain-containing protein [Bacteroidales bacterium]|nr:SPOR domain-containing protein [Bacteroidales bacterium]